jgi:hypothetical protein
MRSDRSLPLEIVAGPPAFAGLGPVLPPAAGR